MIRERDDAVSTYIKTTETPVLPNPFVKACYWDEVTRQINLLLGDRGTRKLADILTYDAVLRALYRKSEQSRVDLIIMLQRQGRI